MVYENSNNNCSQGELFFLHIGMKQISLTR